MANFTRIEFLTHEPDREGKYTFVLYWMANYHPGDPAGENRLAERGQVFHADPHKYGFETPMEEFRRKYGL